MLKTRNAFKSYLILSIRNKENRHDYKNIIEEINKYSETNEFEEKFQEWKVAFVDHTPYKNPKHISKLF